MSRLAGKVAIVTGASSGIGLASAQRLAQEGAKVVLAARTQSKLDEAVKKIKEAGGDAVGVVADVSVEADNKKVVDSALQHHGRVDIAFLNAGMWGAGLVAEITEETVDKVLGANVKSVIFGFKYVLPAIEKSGGGGSVIVNTSGMGSRVPVSEIHRGAGVYSASKAAADMLVKYAAIEAAAHKTRVNALAPGIVATNIGGMSEAQSDAFGAPQQLIGRAGRGEEIASFVAYLASDEATFVTGSVLLVDGGWSLKA